MVGLFSFIESRWASSQSLVVCGLLLVALGCVAASLAVPSAGPPALGAFIFNALLIPTAAAGLTLRPMEHYAEAPRDGRRHVQSKK